MKERLRSLVLLASGLVLIGAGLLGLHLSQPGGPPAMGLVQPPASYLRSEGMRSARLFPGFKVLAVYTYRAPDLKRQTGGVSGIFSQVLAILGNPSGAVLAVKEYVGPPSDPTMEVTQLGQGWSTALPPSAYPVHPERLRELRTAATPDVAMWLHTGGRSRLRPVVWPFPGGTIVVVTAHGQSYARLFQAGGSSTPLLGDTQDGLAGSRQMTFFVQQKR